MTWYPSEGKVAYNLNKIVSIWLYAEKPRVSDSTCVIFIPYGIIKT